MLVVSHEGNVYTLHDDTVEDKQVVRHMTELVVFPVRMDPRDNTRIDRREILTEAVGHRERSSQEYPP
jgi:hypothetical protein